jgi:hypothetical protein
MEEPKKRGRPRLENKRRKTAGVSVSQEELKVLDMIRIDLGYKSVSALLRSAITKGIQVSIKGTYTSSQDIVYWQYLNKHWNSLAHLQENEQHLKIMESLKKLGSLVESKKKTDI